MSRTVLAAATFACLVGCTAEPEVGQQDAAATPVRRLLLCQQGLSDRTLGWDKGLFALCESVEDAGFELVWDGDYPAFGALDEDGAYEALFEALDTNGDGGVDDGDQRTAVHLVGFSWGGINVTDLAKRLNRDDRVAWWRRGVSGMVLLDPFQPQVSRSVIPSNVLDAWVYRQTETTSGDCSIEASLGFGFNGHRPKALNDDTFCTHYDLDRFRDGVGHCDVPTVARKAAFENLVRHRDYAPWADWAESCPLE